jgi:hypothetical protein
MTSKMKQWALAALTAATLVSVPAASIAGDVVPRGRAAFKDSSQAFNANVIAGASPNVQATFKDGIRCSYAYRIVGGVKRRFEVCN